MEQNKQTKSRPKAAQPKKKVAKQPKIKLSQKTVAAVASSIKVGTFQKISGNPKFPGSIKLRGHEYVTAVNGIPSVDDNHMIMNMYINPLALNGTRLAGMARLYEKYRFSKLIFHYVTALPTTSTGQYVMAYDVDFADQTPAEDTDGTREIFAMRNSVMETTYANASMECTLSDPQDWYYTNNTGYEGRIVYQGQFYVFALSGATVRGSVWVEYEIELFEPQLEPPTSSTIYKRQGPFDQDVIMPLSSKWNNSDCVNGFQGLAFVSGDNQALIPYTSLNSGPLSNETVNGFTLSPGKYRVDLVICPGDNGQVAKPTTMPYLREVKLRAGTGSYANQQVVDSYVEPAIIDELQSEIDTSSDTGAFRNQLFTYYLNFSGPQLRKLMLCLVSAAEFTVQIYGLYVRITRLLTIPNQFAVAAVLENNQLRQEWIKTSQKDRAEYSKQNTQKTHTVDAVAPFGSPAVRSQSYVRQPSS